MLPAISFGQFRSSGKCLLRQTLVFRALGTVLLVAAWLKVYQLTAAPQAAA